MSSDRLPSRVWPPRGWKEFETLTNASGQAITKDIQTARIFGLSYRIDCEPIYEHNRRLNRFSIYIGGWEYSILNESTEYPILSFNILDCYDPHRTREHFVSDIRILSRPSAGGSVAVRRLVMASLLIMKQISVGQVPDVDRILRMYRLYPPSTVFRLSAGGYGPAIKSTLGERIRH